MSTCGFPTIFCVLILLLLGAFYATASVQVSSLPGIITDVRPRDPLGTATAWRRRIWKQADWNKSHRVSHFASQRYRRVLSLGVVQGRITDAGRRSSGVFSHRRSGGRRGNPRPIVDNQCGPDGCGAGSRSRSGRGGRGRGNGRRRIPGSPFSKRQLKLAQKLTNSTAIFAGNLLTSTLGRGRLRDFCLSPFSVHLALTMLTLGAKGSTQRQINNVAGLKATRLRRTKAHRAYHTILTSLSTIHPTVRLLTANAVFVKRGIPLELAFRKNLEQLYQAKFSYYPYAPVLETPINDWVSMATQNNIPKLLTKGTIKNSTEMVVINAMALSAAWKQPFNISLTRPHVFETLRKELKEVQMMEMSSVFRYKEEQGMKVIELPYQSGHSARLAMYIVLPDLSSNLRQLTDMLTGKNRTNPRGASSIEVLFQNLRPENIKLRMPRFKVEPDVLDLSKVLRRMGIRKAFNKKKANFTGISYVRQLRLDKFLHQTVVQVDERGSYAKLPTPPAPVVNTTPMDDDQLSMELVVDRPFMFFIHDVHTRLTLINGIYTGEDLGRPRRKQT